MNKGLYIILAILLLTLMFLRLEKFKESQISSQDQNN
jgi:hypothetical protein